jgi:hypothetical protein
MYRNSFLKQVLLGLIVVLFASCDKDFNEIGTDIISDDHFGFEKYTDASIVAFNQKLGPIASNNLEINSLGIYNNPAFGKTTASFVTQLELGTSNPIFSNIETPAVIDSVIVNIPYFSTLLDTDSDGNKTYELDSIYGQDLSAFKLSVFESGYYLRDLDPSQQLAGQQLFYSDKNSEIDSYKIGSRLNDSDNTEQNDSFFFDPKQIKETSLNDDDEEVVTKSVPAMRLHLNKDFFTQKILNAPNGQLFNNNLFKNYLRGLYFKVESNGSSSGNMAMINFKKGTVTVYYKQDVEVTLDEVVTVERLNKTLVMKMVGNTVSLLENSNESADYINATSNPDPTLGDEKLFLKGGQGSVAVIDIFGTTDTDGNGVVDEVQAIQENGWLINEANLTFYVDKDNLTMQNTSTIEPERIFLYDLKNGRPLIDYTFDSSTNSSFPKKGKTTHGGMIEREDVDNGRGVRYKIRITRHVINLIKEDSTNVRLGLSITDNINNVIMSKLKTANIATDEAPTMSVISPVGTILFGTKVSANVPESKRLKLEIYYTKPD